MKNLLKLLVVAVLFVSCSEQSNFVIKGKIDGIRKGQIFLEREIDGQIIKVDSTLVMDESQFEFKGRINTPELMFISTSVANSRKLPVFVEKGEMKVEANIENLSLAEVEGSENQKLLSDYSKMIQSFNMRKNELYVRGMQILSKDSNAVLDSVNTAIEKNEYRKTMYSLNFAVTNSNKDIAPYIALNYLLNEHITVLDTISKSMSDEVKNGIYGQELSELVSQLKATAVGNSFPEISSLDSNNVSVEIKNPNNYFLVNFYSSAQENRADINNMLNELHQKYSDSGFKIFSISLDINRQSWVQALEEDQTKWINLCDFKGKNSAVVRVLGIRNLPENILVDPKGKIIARNVNQDEINLILSNN